jgi:phasin family protein
MVDAGNGLFKAVGPQPLTISTNNPSLPEGLSMTSQDTEKAGKTAFDMALNAFGVWAKGAQTVTIEVIEYTKKSAESSAAAWERLVGAKTLDGAFEVQSDFARSAYEEFVAEAAKLGEIYVEFAREAYAPLRTAFAEPLR